MTKLARNYPEPSRMIHALSQIGYRLEDSIADLIDNSIAAGAKSVLIRFLHDGDKVLSMVIADDGRGMSRKELDNAMKFGSRESEENKTLGKFGMGLKLASFSHCDELTVCTKRNGRTASRRWTVENISRGWLVENVPSEEGRKNLGERWADLNLKSSGTVVFWNRLKGFPQHKLGLRSSMSLIERRLRLHLGLTFHRYIERHGFTIKMDQQTIGRRSRPHFISIDPVDPFGYQQSGDTDFPLLMKSGEMEEIGSLKMVAHIWPPKSEDPEYRLGKRAASHQGFYIYRNDRLIQAGGWNGVVNDDSEPHSSLARISLDLPPEFDDHFSLNVQKTAVVTPLGFPEAMRTASADNGMTWDDFRKASIDAYRQSNAENNVPVPGNGFPRPFREVFKRTEGVPICLRTRKELPEPVVLDMKAMSIVVDSRIRNGAMRGSDLSWDTLTVLLYEMFSESFRNGKVGVNVDRKLSSLNGYLRKLMSAKL